MKARSLQHCFLCPQPRLNPPNATKARKNKTTVLSNKPKSKVHSSKSSLPEVHRNEKCLQGIKPGVRLNGSLAYKFPSLAVDLGRDP